MRNSECFQASLLYPTLELPTHPVDIKSQIVFRAQRVIQLSNLTHCGSAHSSLQLLCMLFISLPVGFFSMTGKSLHPKTVLKQLLYSFVVFPGHKSLMVIKEEFYNIATIERE